MSKEHFARWYELKNSSVARKFLVVWAWEQVYLNGKRLGLGDSIYNQRYSRLVECMTAVKSAYPQAYAFDPFFKIAKQLVLAADSSGHPDLRVLGNLC